MPHVSAAEALRMLREGNGRFAAGCPRQEPFTCAEERRRLVGGQQPFAIVLSCSDSRVPAELVFDQGVGDLFVIRVAGNVVAPALVGSVEFAAYTFHTRLVVVMGHSKCGAVTATLDALLHREAVPSDNVRDIVERIRAAAVTVLSTSSDAAWDDVLARAIRANVLVAVDHLRHGSRILESLVHDHDLEVVGAEYDLETGLVDFFELPDDLAAP
jgi:carbonic anhydrase